MTIPVLKRKLEEGGYKNYELRNTVTTIGRSSSCDIVVNDTSLSRLHLRLENRADRFFLIDNNSSNGTYLNRRKITEALLKDGDAFMTGRVHFVFSQETEKAGEKTQPLSLIDAPQVSSTVSVPKEELPSGASLEFEAFKKSDPTFDDDDDTEAAKETVPTPRSPLSPPPPPPPPVNAPPFGSPDATVDVPMSGMVASPGRRLLAFILDIGVGIALSIPGVVMGVLGMGVLATLVSLLGSLAGLLHFVIGWLKYGKTIGKHLMGVHIIEIERAGQQGLSPKAVVLRLIGSFLCAIPLFLPFLAILADSEGRGIHDKIAGTRVVAS
jgi:uncharacterized RDD family membrane protein YckC